MREEQFGRWLERRLGSIGSYISRLRRVERELEIDLDQVGLSPDGIDRIAADLLARPGNSFTQGSLDDVTTALRRYGEFLQEA